MDFITTLDKMKVSWYYSILEIVMNKTHKRCKKCQKIKEMKEFHYHKASGGPGARCKLCTNEQSRAWRSANRDKARAAVKAWMDANPDRLRLSYRSTHLRVYWPDLKPLERLMKYEEMLKKQNGVCAICSSAAIKGSLPVDHCHKTNKIRGLLCENCNRGLGLFKDEPEFLIRAANYILSGDLPPK
jgi:hypothetical protein